MSCCFYKTSFTFIFFCTKNIWNVNLPLQISVSFYNFCEMNKALMRKNLWVLYGESIQNVSLLSVCVQSHHMMSVNIFCISLLSRLSCIAENMYVHTLRQTEYLLKKNRLKERDISEDHIKRLSLENILYSP